MNNFLVDTHCHLFKEYYNDLSEVIDNAKKNQVSLVINNGCDKKSNEEVIESINKNPSIYGAIGIHPENVDDYNNADLTYIEQNLNNPKIVAIGEIGLDYHYTKENKNEQIALMELQLKLAEKYNMPVIIHSREATEDTINTLKKYNVKGTIHSFSGSLETARIYIKMGYLLGINGVITFKNSHLKDTIKEIGLENIILETDSPYLTPEPYRGKQNNPGHVQDIAKFIADLFDLSVEEVAKITNENIKKLYKKIHID